MSREETANRRYRVTIRSRQESRGYEVFEVDAPDLRAALDAVRRQFPAAWVENADLIEIRLANPAE
jgi:hypothetical protein